VTGPATTGAGQEACEALEFDVRLRNVDPGELAHISESDVLAVMNQEGPGRMVAVIRRAWWQVKDSNLQNFRAGFYSPYTPRRADPRQRPPRQNFPRIHRAQTRHARRQRSTADVVRTTRSEVTPRAIGNPSAWVAGPDPCRESHRHTVWTGKRGSAQHDLPSPRLSQRCEIPANLLTRRTRTRILRKREAVRQ
jgi:hypothetical protein